MDSSPSWFASAPELIVEGVHRIPLRISVPGLPAVNMYALHSADGLVLVDPGENRADLLERVRTGLRLIGRDLDDVREIWVTHAHPDHYTGALSLRQRYGIPVLLGQGERHSVIGYTDHGRAMDVHLARLRSCGCDDLAGRFAAQHARTPRYAPWGAPNSWLASGDGRPAAGGNFEVIATPGHTTGHVVFRSAQLGITLTGDHVLPEITPSLGFELAPEAQPLASYLESLRRLSAADDTQLLPAHGPRVASLHARVRELQRHHADRLDAARAAVQRGTRSVAAVTAELRWTTRQLRLDQLSLTSQVLAVLETYDHLNLLVSRGELLLASRRGVVEFRSASSRPEGRLGA